jgi:hypothetical protein
MAASIDWKCSTSGSCVSRRWSGFTPEPSRYQSPRTTMLRSASQQNPAEARESLASR